MDRRRFLRLARRHGPWVLFLLRAAYDVFKLVSEAINYPMTTNYEYRFEVRPGRFVYLPTDDARREGERIRRDILSKWSPAPVFFHLFRRGGHVVAAKHHAAQRYFGKRDIDHFFGKVTKTKVARSLERIGFDYRTAFNTATNSVVSAEIGKHVPYGFVQSPVLATLALEKSALGSFLLRSRHAGLTVTAFMDDIAFSSNDPELVRRFGSDLEAAAEKARFPFAAAKTVECATKMEVFNCSVEEGQLQITEERMKKFLGDLPGASAARRSGMINYVNAINETQGQELMDSLASL